MMWSQIRYVCSFWYVVLKAERISINDSVDEGYMFPDEDDNLATYTGGNTQLIIPSDLLQDISK